MIPRRPILDRKSIGRDFDKMLALVLKSSHLKDIDTCMTDAKAFELERFTLIECRKLKVNQTQRPIITERRKLPMNQRGFMSNKRNQS